MTKDDAICLTGHRPKLLPWKYDEKKESCIKFKQQLNNILRMYISGGKKPREKMERRAKSKI